MTHILGFDAGGTSSRLALADREGQVVFWRDGYGLALLIDPNWETRLAERMAPIASWKSRLSGAVLGLPAYGEVDNVSARQTALARELATHKARVVHHVALAHAGAFADAEGLGVVLFAGTGSMAWADRAGAHLGEAPGVAFGVRGGAVRSGGWGEVLGDEGSAHWIGIEALRRTTHVLDGREDDLEFADAVLDAVGVEADLLLPWVYRGNQRRRTIASLAPVVTGLAHTGNPTAIALVDEAAGHLHAALMSAWRRVGGTGVPVWAAAGGLFADSGLTASVTRRVGSRPRRATLPPVGGALLLAAKLAGWAPGPDYIAALAQSLDDGSQARDLQES